LSGAGARPVHPIRVISLRRRKSVALGAKKPFSKPRLHNRGSRGEQTKIRSTK
jgi:hypothetical protein